MDTPTLLTVALAMLGTVAILSVAGLRGFTAWLDLKRQELQHAAPSLPNAGGRIEVADLKERIRKLEAIAAGVEL